MLPAELVAPILQDCLMGYPYINHRFLGFEPKNRDRDVYNLLLPALRLLDF